MKIINVFAVLILVIVLLSCDSHEVREVKHLLSDQPAERYSVIKTSNGSFVNDGLYESWYMQGTLQEQGNYTDGQRDGRWKEWYANGQIKTDAEYENGELTGKYTAWYENGQIWAEATMKNGARIGTYKLNHDNGQPGLVISYDLNGELNGQYTGHDKNGNIYLSRTYVNGVDTDLPATYAKGTTTLILNADGTYEYSDTGIFSFHSKGKFKLNDGKVVMGEYKYTLFKFTKDEISWQEGFQGTVTLTRKN